MPPVIRMLRGNPDGTAVRIYGTNVDPAAPAFTACDVSEVEPRHVSNEDYAAFALDFCRRHGIDVLIPPRRLDALAPHAAAFAEAGTKLMCSPPSAIEVLTSKSRTYEEALAAGVPVPVWRVVSDSAGLCEAAAEIGANGDQVCIKPAGEYSAFGFRILDDRPLHLSDLMAAPRPLASLGAVADAMDRAAEKGETVPEFIVMPYLDGPEVSVDCLSAPGGAMVTSIARSKDGRFRLLLDDPEVTAIARRLVARFGLAYLSNVQLRHWNGQPVLLEANPRPSAGIFQTAFTGVNLPWAAVRLLLHEDPGPLDTPLLGGRVAVTYSVTEVDSGRRAVPELPVRTVLPALSELSELSEPATLPLVPTPRQGELSPEPASCVPNLTGQYPAPASCPRPLPLTWR